MTRDRLGTKRSRRGEIADEQWDLRVQLAALYRIFAAYGWDELVNNHLSVRVPSQPGRFLVHPWGLMFEEVRASDLVEVDLQGNVIDGEAPRGINPAGFVLHGAVYQARHDVQCVLHCHPVAGCAVSIQEGGLLPISGHALFYRDLVAYHDLEGISLDADEQKRIQDALGEARTILFLRNHGLLTCGRTIAEAFLYMYWIEKACQIQIQAQAGGSRLVVPAKPVQDRCALQIQAAYNWEAGTIELAAWMRKLDRVDPSYRD
jgi:ribulose-5-phosphate 4-epimerase/fuculose-1-phosphate aldolase